MGVLTPLSTISWYRWGRFIIFFLLVGEIRVHVENQRPVVSHRHIITKFSPIHQSNSGIKITTPSFQRFNGIFTFWIYPLHIPDSIPKLYVFNRSYFPYDRQNQTHLPFALILAPVTDRKREYEYNFLIICKCLNLV